MLGMAQIVDRAGWGARPPKRPLSSWPAGQPTGVAVHWEGAGGVDDHSRCHDEVRSIQNFHMDGPGGYVDIAYNWCVCNHGVVFEGRPADRFQSAAQGAGNGSYISICYLGGPSMPFSEAAKAAINDVIAGSPGAAQGNVRGHKNVPGNATACPGPEIDGWLAAGRPASGSVPTPAPSPPPPPKPQNQHPVLRKGSRGPAVMELQRKLNGVAGQGLVVDGSFGPRTDQAVRNFQTFFNLGTDGIVGPKTWGALDYFASLKGVR